MALPGLLPSTDFKKNYTFYWQLNGLSSSIFTDPLLEAKKFKNLAYVAFRTLAVAQMVYVSQLAESIDLPDDEVEIEEYDVGSVKLPVVKGFKMPDIQVTYLEDTGNTVYNFHKMWMNCIKSRSGFDLNTIRPWCMEGWYLPLDKSTNQYVAIANSLLDKVKGAASLSQSGSHIFNPLVDGLGDSVTSLRGLQIYPLIFPTRISRGTMTKSGNDLSKIIVTYKRFPYLKNKTSNCSYYKGSHIWVPIEQSGMLS